MLRSGTKLAMFWQACKDHGKREGATAAKHSGFETWEEVREMLWRQICSGHLSLEERLDFRLVDLEYGGSVDPPSDAPSEAPSEVLSEELDVATEEVRAVWEEVDNAVTEEEDVATEEVRAVWEEVDNAVTEEEDVATEEGKDVEHDDEATERFALVEFDYGRAFRSGLFAQTGKDAGEGDEATERFALVEFDYGRAFRSGIFAQTMLERPPEEVHEWTREVCPWPEVVMLDVGMRGMAAILEQIQMSGRRRRRRRRRKRRTTSNINSNSNSRSSSWRIRRRRSRSGISSRIDGWDSSCGGRSCSTSCGSINRWRMVLFSDHGIRNRTSVASKSVRLREQRACTLKRRHWDP